MLYGDPRPVGFPGFPELVFRHLLKPFQCHFAQEVGAQALPERFPGKTVLAQIGAEIIPILFFIVCISIVNAFCAY